MALFSFLLAEAIHYVLLAYSAKLNACFILLLDMDNANATVALQDFASV